MSEVYNLFCLPSAGSHSTMYSAWCDFLPYWMKIHPIEYPGHGTRCSDPLIDNAEELVQDILQQILFKASENIILFGHSLGAALAWRVIQALQGKGLYEAVKLLVLSGRPETSTLQMSNLHPSYLTQEQLLSKVRTYEGMPPSIIDNQDALNFFLPILQNDLCVNEDLINDTRIVLNKPLWVVTGDVDPITHIDAAEKWKNWTKQWKGIRCFPGGHFFLNQKECIQQIIYGIEKIILEHTKEPSSITGEKLMQDTLIHIVSTTLNLSKEEIPYQENLLSLGLNSLSLMSIAEQLTTKFEKNITFSDLMKEASIQAWSELIRKPS